LLTALCFYLGAFALWLLERKFCAYVQVFQFHALWHIGTAVGTFLFVQFAIYHRMKTLKLDPVLGKYYILLYPGGGK